MSTRNRKKNPLEDAGSPAEFLAYSVPKRRTKAGSRTASSAAKAAAKKPSTAKKTSATAPTASKAKSTKTSRRTTTLPSPPRPKLNLKKARTYSLGGRPSKVQSSELGKPHQQGNSFKSFFDGLPDILAAQELRVAIDTIAKARRKGRGVALGMGAHPIKVGLAPVIVDLMERGIITSVALNGAGIIHDFEMACAGKTSEDVGPGLDKGKFGMARETGATLNGIIKRGAKQKIGLGEAVGQHIAKSRYPHKHLSILGAGARLDVPVTVHVAVGTDIIHMHPSADGAAIGQTSMADFHRLAGVVAGLDRGVYINLGSAVILPEVFVKALNLARNLGHKVKPLYTLDMDFLRHYRPGVNVISRPTAAGGQGIRITGHHELMFPLLAAALIEELG